MKAALTREGPTRESILPMRSFQVKPLEKKTSWQTTLPPRDLWVVAQSAQTISPATIRGLGQTEEEARRGIMTILSIAGGAASAYHGYKRNESVGWAVVWGLLGSIVPILTIPIALAQGFGKKRS